MKNLSAKILATFTGLLLLLVIGFDIVAHNSDSSEGGGFIIVFSYFIIIPLGLAFFACINSIFNTRSKTTSANLAGQKMAKLSSTAAKQQPIVSLTRILVTIFVILTAAIFGWYIFLRK